MATIWVKWVLEAAPIHDRNELLLLVVLAEAANPEGYCWPSKKTLARAMRMDERSIPRIAQRLQAKNLIRVTSRQRTNGSQTSNGYQLLVDHHYANAAEDVTPLMTQESSQARTQESCLEPSVEPQKELKDSPAEKSSCEDNAVPAPDGDAHAGDASRSETPQPEKAFLVKAQDSLKSVNLPDREESLPVSSRAAILPAARATRPVIDVPRRLPEIPQRSAHSHKPGATATNPNLNLNLMPVVVTHAFKIGQGGYAGKISQFLQGALPRRRKDMWSQSQPEIAASPQEIMALLAWYRQHPAYASSCAERGGKLPSTPAILRDRLDEFRDSVGYMQAMQAAQPLLDRLLRGESIMAPVPVKSPPTGPIESAAAYTGYASDIDRAYGRTSDSSTAEIFETLFGEPS